LRPGIYEECPKSEVLRGLPTALEAVRERRTKRGDKTNTNKRGEEFQGLFQEIKVTPHERRGPTLALANIMLDETQANGKKLIQMLRKQIATRREELSRLYAEYYVVIRAARYAARPSSGWQRRVALS
jgi:hypothetical protein